MFQQLQQLEFRLIRNHCPAVHCREAPVYIAVMFPGLCIADG